MKCIYSFMLLVTLLFFRLDVNASVSVSAKSAVLIDAETGRILFEKNASEKRSMASTTKIITAITAIENGSLSDTVVVSKNAASTEGSSVWLTEGETLTLSELLYALMLESGNDASVAIAEHIGGSVEGFAVLMNETCRKAGAISTNCVTPSGLDDDMHYTTALDMAKIAGYAMRSKTFRDIVSTYKASIPWEGQEWDRTLVNHNKLLTMYDGADGIKTGYTKKSGRCLVSSATKDGWRVIAVTLDANDDWNDHIRMFDYAFDTYRENMVLLKKNEIIGEISVEGSKDGFLAYGAECDLSVRKLGNDVSYDYKIPEKLTAPVASGEVIGTVCVSLDGTFYREVNLVTLSEAKKDSYSFMLEEALRKLLKILLYSVR